MTARKVVSMPVRWVADRAGYRVERKTSYDVALYSAICQLRRWSPRDVVFDVGANDGRTIHILQRHLPSPRILAFEPVAGTFEVLKQQTADYPNVECVQLAMGSEQGRSEIYINESAALNSLHEGWGSGSARETIDVTTLDAFLVEHPVERIHLLKIDTEGHDLEVLKGAAQSLAKSQVEIIMVEAGFAAPGRPQPVLWEVQDYLKPFGYYLYGIYNQCRMSLARRLGETEQPDNTAEILIYCDALFVHGGR
jgi:FkbM family methyltransferase